MAAPGTIALTVGILPSSRAAKYAEELGVTRLASEASQLIVELEPMLRRRAFLDQQIRNAVQFQDERERDLLADIIAEGTATSIAAQDRALKNDKAKDEAYHKLTIELVALRDELSDVEVNIRITEHKIRNLHNQMNLLSSHLDYLAAAKQDQTVNRVLGAA